VVYAVKSLVKIAGVLARWLAFTSLHTVLENPTLGIGAL